MSKSEELKRRAQALEQESFRDLWATAAACGSELAQLSPIKRKMWLAEVVQELYAAQSGMCGLCGGPLSPDDLHVDHRIPFCYGGGNERGNLQLAHPTCNLRKGSGGVDPTDVIRYLEGRMMNY